MRLLLIEVENNENFDEANELVEKLLREEELFRLYDSNSKDNTEDCKNYIMVIPASREVVDNFMTNCSSMIDMCDLFTIGFRSRTDNSDSEHLDAIIRLGKGDHYYTMRGLVLGHFERYLDSSTITSNTVEIRLEVKIDGKMIGIRRSIGGEFIEGRGLEIDGRHHYLTELDHEGVVDTITMMSDLHNDLFELSNSSVFRRMLVN